MNETIKSLLTAPNFPEAYEKVKDKLKIKDFLDIKEDEPNKDTSLLWRLALEAAYGRPNAFMAFWNKYKDEVKIDHLRVKATSGFHKDVSILWLLATAAANDPAPLLAVLEKFQDDITLDDLRTESDGAYKKQSMLWLLIGAAAKGHTAVLMPLWQKFFPQITLEELRTKVQNGPHNGMSAWWLMTLALYNGHSAILYDALQKFKDKITLNDLSDKPEHGKLAESVLGLLAGTAMKGDPKAILTLWDKFSEKNPQTNINSIALKLIAKVLPEHGLIGQLFNFMESIFSEKNPLIDLISKGHNRSAARYVLNLAKTRDSLLRAIARAHDDDILSKESIHSLLSYAASANKAGYAQAYYDLGTFFLEKNDPKAAFEAFKNLPESNYSIVGKNFVEAAAKNKAAYQEHLIPALWFTLRVSDENKKEELVHTIAYCHVNEGKKAVSAQEPFVDPSVIACFSPSSNLENCFKVFKNAHAKALEVKNKPLVFLQKMPASASLNKNNASEEARAESPKKSRKKLTSSC